MTNNFEITEDLEQFINKMYTYAITEGLDGREVYYYQAYGAVNFFMYHCPEAKKQICELWKNKYAPQFLKLIRDAAI